MARVIGPTTRGVEGLPATTPRIAFKGLLHVAYNTKFQRMIARSWPRGNGGMTARRLLAIEKFKQMVLAAKFARPEEVEEARRVSVGTAFTWRDVVQMAATGRFYWFVDQRGKITMGWAMAFQTVQVLLDAIFNTPGCMLVRAPEGWVALLAGDDGDVLTFDTTAQIPQWKPGAVDVQDVLDQLAPSIGDVVKFNGTDWEAVSLSGLYDSAGAAAAALVSAEAYADAAVAAIPLSSTAAFGLVKPDNVSTVCVGGVMSAQGFLSTGAGAHPGIQAGRFYGTPYVIGNSTTAFSVNILYAVPIYVPAATTFTKFALRYGSIASGTSKFAVYSNLRGIPDQLLFDLGNHAQATSVFQVTTGLSFSLAPGWYWLAVGHNVSGGAIINSFSGTAGNGWLIGMNDANGNSAAVHAGWTYTTGAPPTTFPGPLTYDVSGPMLLIGN